MNRLMLRYFKFSVEPYLVALPVLLNAALRPSFSQTPLNPVSGIQFGYQNHAFRASGTDFGILEVSLVSQEIQNQSITQRGRGLTKCWCSRGCLSRPLRLDSDTQSERTSLYEWAPGALQRGAGPAPDRGATSYFATI